MKIPPNAKSVFKGVMFELFQWEQTLYDGSTATFERAWRPDTYQVLAVKDNKILVVKDEQPDRDARFTLAGGREEPTDASPLAGAQRELLEETGLVSDRWELFQAVEPVGKLDWTVHLFIAHDCITEQEPQLDPGEKIELQWLTFDEFIELASSETFYEKDLTLQILRMRLKGQAALDQFKKRLGIT